MLVLSLYLVVVYSDIIIPITAGCEKCPTHYGKWGLTQVKHLVCLSWTERHGSSFSAMHSKEQGLAGRISSPQCVKMNGWREEEINIKKMEWNTVFIVCKRAGFCLTFASAAVLWAEVGLREKKKHATISIMLLIYLSNYDWLKLLLRLQPIVNLIYL